MFIAAQRQLAILLPALLAATLALACTSGDAPPPAVGFYAEVAIEVEHAPDSPVARLGSAERRHAIRWWYARDPARWRWEIETVGSIIDDGVVLTVVDGDDFREYDDRSNTYRRGALVVVPAGVMLLPTYNALVGPANAETIDALIEQWRERGDHPEVSLAGEATLLGRRTQIVEIRSPSGGGARAFVDPKRMFIMRWAGDGEAGGQSYSSEVTALDYDTEIDAGRFTFDPPPGAREVVALPLKRPVCGIPPAPGGAAFLAEPGFLSPSFRPPGFDRVGVSYEGDATGGCGSIAVSALLEAPDGGYILLRQRLRPGGIPRAARSWQPVDSSLEEAYRNSAGGVLSLLWRDGDIVALLESDSVSFEELLRIAESSDLVPPAP